MNWEITQSGYDAAKITTMENRFLTGNGYLGIRGALEEYTAAQLPAINLAGIYDQVGDAWREPLNAPNGLYTWLKVDGTALRLPGDTCDPENQESRGNQEKAHLVDHRMTLDFRHGIFKRETTWRMNRGQVTVCAQRFADRRDVHRIALRYTVAADFHAEMELHTGIDGAVWDINGPHYDRLETALAGAGEGKEPWLTMEGVTHEKHDRVTVWESAVCKNPSEKNIYAHDRRIMRTFRFISNPGRPFAMEKFLTVFTSQDPDYDASAAKRSLLEAETAGYEAVRAAHMEAWEDIWQYAAVEIGGDEQAEMALNYSLYHLQCIAPRHASGLSIPARGLSGQTYKGAVFWDTEMFMLDYFLFTDPAAARSLLAYRVDTLEGAKKKAADYGLAGAFYAWESQEGGYDACSDYNVTDVFSGRPMRTYFKDKQIHISAAIAYGILRYTEITGDHSLLEEGGAKVLVECARFYDSLLMTHAATPETYELLDVIGPDEYHERVDNNAYTNRMAKMTFEAAARVLQGSDEIGKKAKDELAALYDVQALGERFAKDAERLYIPAPGTDGIIEQFDGYLKLEDCSVDTVRSRILNPKEYWGGAYGVATHTQVIKQADVVTMLNLFSEEYPESILHANWDYYEPRTEHGSSLSASMYAMLACKCGMSEKAYPFFIKSAMADLTEGGKEWAGLIYIGGTHPAAAGGAYMIAVEGFGGVSFTKEGLQVKPNLPPGWTGMAFYISHKGRRYHVEIRDGEVKVQ